MSRQVEYVESDDGEEDEEPAKMSLYPGNGDEGPPALSGLSLDDTHFIGCNGRVNKSPDTCYSFWVGASLDVSRTFIRHGFILTRQDDWPV